MVADGVSIVSRRNQESQNAPEPQVPERHPGRAMYCCGGLREAAGRSAKPGCC